MPDLIVDLSEAYLKSKVESAFMNAASCKNVYDRSINALGSTWYIDKVQVNAVGLSSGAAATAVDAARDCQRPRPRSCWQT